MQAVGVDGCRGGWVAADRGDGGAARFRVFPTFSALLEATAPDAIIAVDMPIGLPDSVGHAGRGPEALVRRHLGPRQSSVFTIPSRAAVQAEPGPFADAAAMYDAHSRASAVARRTSDPPRAISIQAFGLFPRIRELDALLRADAALRGRIFESHPELAFWRLNGGTPMRLPKKIKGTVNPAGMAERRGLLVGCGLVADAEMPPRRLAGEDDVLDACAMLLVAERIAAGLARPMPDPPLADAFGIPIAIWS